jgi:DNA (cytosine-5)-methyltransferase 1
MFPLRPIAVGRIGEDGQSKQGYRIYSDRGIAVTFCARGGGVGGTTGLYLVNGRVRRLHPRESARAMGFPDTFVLPPEVSDEQARSLFGNSVAVPVVRRIFDRIVETLSPRGPTSPDAPSPGPSRDRAPWQAEDERAGMTATEGRGEA